MKVWIWPPVAAIDSVKEVPDNCFHDAAVYETGCTLPRRWVCMATGQAVSCLLTGSLCGSKSDCSQYCSLSLCLPYTQTLRPHTHTLSWSHCYSQTQNLSFSLFPLHFTLSSICTGKFCRSWIPRVTVTIFTFLQIILYICERENVCVVILFPDCIPLCHLKFSPSDLQAFMGHRTKKPIFLSLLAAEAQPTQEQDLVRIGFKENGWKGLERAGGVLWQVCLCVYACGEGHTIRASFQRIFDMYSHSNNLLGNMMPFELLLIMHLFLA